MKYVKMLGLLAVAAAAMMAFAGSASATTLTSPAGTHFAGTIEATSEGETTLHGVATITCHHSRVFGHVTDGGGDEKTVKGNITELTFTNCTNGHVTVANAGTLELHTDPEGQAANGNGILTSTGAEVSIQITSLGITCVFTTNNTEVGTVTGSKNTKGTATMDIDSVKIPRTGGSFFCGSSGEWTGSYKVESPDYLDVD